MDPRDLQQIGHFTVRRYVAEGGMAWVFEVQDPSFEHRSRALKVLKPDIGTGMELELFEQESQHIAGIQHPNVVQIYDRGRDEATGLYYYTMEFVHGPSLHELIQQQGALDPERACEMFLGVLAGLEQIHNQNVVHRDITPRNILVAPPDDRAVLMDLGIAREATDSEGTQYTQVIRGTPLYMSPEQSSGKRPTKSSDIFSLGLTLYYCLKGQTVYDDTDTVDATNPHGVREHLGYLNVSNREFEINLPRKVPKPIREVVRKACRMDARARYADAAEMRVALREAMRAGGGPPWRMLAAAAGVAGLAFGVWSALPWVQGVVREWRTEAPALPPVEKADTGTEAPEKLAGTPEERAEQAAELARELAARQAVVEGLPAEYAAALKEASGLVAEADQQRTAQSWSEATLLYDKAARVYQEASQVAPADQAREEAKARIRRALQLADRGKLEDKESVGRAEVLVSRGETAYAAGQYEKAKELFGQATMKLGSVPGNLPPTLTPEPKDETLVLAKRQDLEFSVSADDPDPEDKLSYRWTVDGKERDEEGTALKLSRVSKDMDVAVLVSDGENDPVEQRWRVEWNEKPKLSVSPRSKTVSLAPGKSQSFTARASDPDGDAITTEFLLDDQLVGSGEGSQESYVFEANEEGTYKLVVKTTDSHGGSIIGLRTIKVAKIQKPPPTPTTKPPTPTTKPPATATTTPTPTPSGPREQLVATLRDFERAFESCNPSNLQRYYRRTAGQLKAYRDICGSGRVEVQAEPRSEWGSTGGQGWICMQHEVKLVTPDGTQLPLNTSGVYKASLVDRGDGWQIINITKGCNKG